MLSLLSYFVHPYPYDISIVIPLFDARDPEIRKQSRCAKHICARSQFTLQSFSAHFDDPSTIPLGDLNKQLDYSSA